MPSEPTVSSNLSIPAYKVLDTQVLPGERLAAVRVRRDGPTNYSCAMRFGVSGGGARVSPTSGEFVFEHDVDEIVIRLALGEAAQAGLSLVVTLSNLRTYNVAPHFARARAVVSTGVLSTSDVATPLLPASAVSRDWDRPVRRTIDPIWRRDFFSDLVNGFACTATGLDGSGKPCFKNALAHGRAQFSSGEVGLYSDPEQHHTAPLQELGGKRLLVPEKLPSPVTLVQGTQSKTCTHSTPIVSTETNALLGYGRFEYRFALLDPQPGMWPAGWSLVLPPWRWPECEQDTVEISFNKPDLAQVLPYQTNWWRGPGGNGQDEGEFVNVFELLPGFAYRDPHSYWSEWTPERISWGIDEVLTFSAPNRFFLRDRKDPHDPNRVFMMLQIALGGGGGDCGQGVYPVAPSRYAPGAPAMLVDHMAHFAMPLTP